MCIRDRTRGGKEFPIFQPADRNVRFGQLALQGEGLALRHRNILQRLQDLHRDLCQVTHKRNRRCKPCTELRSCVKVEVAVLGSTSLILLVVSVDVKQQ